jgi:hypothetical protein
MRIPRPAHIVCLISTCALLTIANGCSQGPARGEVKGKVTFQGKPVKEGTVTFLNPKEGGAAEAQINQDGTYAVQGGVDLGSYLVVITPPVEIVDTDPGKSPPAPVEKDMPDIPVAYRQQGTTTLNAEVKAGQNEFDFDMMP